MYQPTLNTLAILSTVFIFCSTCAAKDNYQFNLSFLKGESAPIDLEAFLATSRIVPGNYRVDLYSNETLVGRRDIEFLSTPGSNKVTACLTQEIVQQLGVDMGKLYQTNEHFSDDASTCLDLPKIIDHANVRYDAPNLRLLVSIPQIALMRGSRNYVDQTLWDEGITAGFVNYQLSSNRNSSDSRTMISNNIGLRNGINLAGWRLRNESNFHNSTGSRNTFTSNRSYLQHDLTPLKGQLSIGDIFSDSDLFDSVRYRGIKLASDDGMQADSERGYAPVIRGIAQSSATVEIRQNKYILYTANVPPGPFEINDIYPSGSNGDLEVTIIEADGSRRTTTQPFSSLPIMIREGQFKYSLSIGQYRNRADQKSPNIVSSTLAYGIDSDLSAIVGLQSSDNFKALSIGAGRNTLIGAFSLDITNSTSQLPKHKSTGKSVRAIYSKTLTATNTVFTLAAYRYSTEGYRTLSEHVHGISMEGPLNIGSSKTRTDLTVNQSLGNNQQYGYLSVNATDTRYWGRGGSQTFSINYSNYLDFINYNIGIMRSKEVAGYGLANDNTLINLSLLFPLGAKPRAPRAYFSASTQQTETTNQIGINGYLSENSETFYSIQGGNSRTGGNTGSLNLSTRNSFMDMSASYSKGPHYNSQNLNLAGSIVAHQGGINLGQTVGETFALAQVGGVHGVEISNFFGSRTGSNGYAIVPNLQPYRVNWISLDTRNLDSYIDIHNSTKQVVPRRGAVVLARYASITGRRVQFSLYDTQHQPIPFGATLEDQAGKQLAISDPTGKALALVEANTGTLVIHWQGNLCEAHYTLPDSNKTLNYERADLECAKPLKLPPS